METDTNETKKYNTAMLAVEVQMFTDLLMADIETRHPFGCDLLATPTKVKLFGFTSV